MSIRQPADALTKAGDIRAATDRVRVPATRDFSGLGGGDATLILADLSSDQERAAARSVARVAVRLGASRDDCLTVLRALGLAPDPVAGTATNDLGIRKQECKQRGARPGMPA
jgi:hypothetical protein